MNKTVLPITVDDKTFIVIQQVPRGFIWAITDATGTPIPNHPWRDRNTKRFQGYDVPMTTHTFEGIVSHVSDMLEVPASEVSWLMTEWLATDNGQNVGL